MEIRSASGACMRGMMQLFGLHGAHMIWLAHDIDVTKDCEKCCPKLESKGMDGGRHSTLFVVVHFANNAHPQVRGWLNEKIRTDVRICPPFWEMKSAAVPSVEMIVASSESVKCLWHTLGSGSCRQWPLQLLWQPFVRGWGSKFTRFQFIFELMIPSG